MRSKTLRFFRGCLASALVALGAGTGLGSAAAAQEGVTTGSIAGRVLDADGTPLANARIVVRSLERGFTREALTDAQGRFVVGLLQSGRYSVRAELPPRPPAEVSPVRVSVGERTTLDLTLEPIRVEELVARVERGENIDLHEGGVVELVGVDEIESLPTLGRDFTDFILLSGQVSPTPEQGTGGQFAMGGGRQSATNVQIDGVDANNAFFGENRGSSRIPFTFSLESIREFQIITNGYDVEWGNYNGGVVNVVTKGGTNEFRGSGFGFFRDDAIARRNFDGTPNPDFQAWQFGGQLSGPIVKDKAHFFFSFDGQQKDQPVFALVADRWCSQCAGGPDSIARFMDILERVYGLSREELENTIGIFQETEDNLAFFGRIDWQISDRHSLTLRNNYTDFEQLNDRVSSEEALTHGGAFKDQFESFVTELNSVIGASGQAFNTFRFQFSREDRPRPGNNFLPEAEVNIHSSGPRVEYFGDGIVFRNRLEERKFQIIDNLTWQLGDHRLKVGTNNQFTNIKNLFWLFGNGDYRFNSLADFENQNPAFFRRNLRVDNQSPFADFDIAEYSVYVQDEWQLSDRWLWSFGVRYDWDDFLDPAVDAPEVAANFGRSVTVVPTDRDNVSPRVSFTYDLKGDGTSVIRGGGGLFYGRMPFVLHGNVMQTSPPLLSIFCTGASIPPPDYRFFAQAPDGSNNPTRCIGGDAPSGRPQFSVWDPSAENPQSWKLNLGFEQIFGDGWRFAVDGLYGFTQHNFRVADANLRGCDPETLECAPQFRTAVDGRPVFIPQANFNPRFSASSSRRIENSEFDRIFVNLSDAESRAWIFNAKLGKRFTDANLRVQGSYTYNNIKDNSSYPCCTAEEGLRGTPTAGNPNFIGDAGDDLEGSWGPATFERRQVWVMNWTWDAPGGVQISGIWRSQSGKPWTPTVDGDVNADGFDFNDRAPIFQNLRFEDAGEAAQFASILSDGGNAVLDESVGKLGRAGECIRKQVGRIARRGSCRDPWFHSVDLHFSWDITDLVPGVPSSQGFEVIADFFNVLNGLNSKWGRFMGVFSSRTELLDVEGFDPATNEVIYSVNDRFGEVQPIGFDPFQFQMQLGLRYRF